MITSDTCRAVVLALLLGMAWNARAFPFTTYDTHLQNSLQQTGSSSFVAGYDALGIPQYSLVAAVDTGGANLSAAPILGLPAPTNDFPTGAITFPTGPNFSPVWVTGKGYNEYHWGLGYPTGAELNAAFGSGTFTFTLGDATATPTLSQNTVSPTYPISPTVTGGGSWSGGHLLIDATTSATLTFNTSSFTGYSSGAWLGAQIKFELVDSNVMPISAPAVSRNFPSLGKTDPALTSYTIAPGTLVAGQTYNLQANYNVYDAINTTSFTGTGITGNPVGVSGYLTSTFITIDAIELEINAIQRVSNDMHIKFTSVASAIYRVEYRSDLGTGSWQTLVSNISGTGNVIDITDTGGATQGKRFYRVELP